MVERAEGIGSRKWSLLKDPDGRAVVMEGTRRVAIVEDEGVLHLLVTAPQLWDAGNDVMKAASDRHLELLGQMVAKAVGKIDWRDVDQ